jgi:hypothetical protein
MIKLSSNYHTLFNLYEPHFDFGHPTPFFHLMYHFFGDSKNTLMGDAGASPP